MSATPAESALKLARRLPRDLYIGTSSWSFPGWAEIVYSRRFPKPVLAKDGLRAYARHPLLRTVCLDRTYYAPLSSESYATYAAQVPGSFRFVVKAAETCVGAAVRETPKGDPVANRHFLDPIYAAEQLIYPMIEGLGEKAAVFLLQFPPQAGQLPGSERDFRWRLESFLNQLPDGPLYAVELRDRSLLTPEHFQMMASAPAVHCFNIHPRSRPLDRQVDLAGLHDCPLVVRWMLHPGLEYEEARERYRPFDRLVDPQPAMRERVANLCKTTLESGHAAFVIINNKAEGCAPLSVFALAEKVAAKF